MGLTKSQVLVVVFVCSCYLLTSVSVTIPAPFLPRQTELHGLDATVTGWMMGYLSLINFIFSFVYGKLAKYFCIKKLFMFGAFANAIFMGLFGILEFIPKENSIEFIVVGFLIRTLQGIGFSGVLNCGQTYVAQVFKEKRIFALSIVSTIGGMGMMTGPALGSALFEFGFIGVFAGAGGIYTLLAICSLIFLPSPSSLNSSAVSESALQNGDIESEREPLLTNKSQNNNSCDNTAGGSGTSATATTTIPYKDLLLNRRMAVALICNIFAGATWAALDPILEPELRHKYGFTEQISGLIFLLLAGSYAIASPIIGYGISSSILCTDSLTRVVIALIFRGLVFAMIGPSPVFGAHFERPLWLMLTMLAVLGIFHALLFQTVLDMFYDFRHLDAETQAQDGIAIKAFMTGMFHGFKALGRFAGMALAGTLTAYLGFAWTMTITSGFCFFLCLVSAGVKLSEATHLCFR